MRIRFGFVCDQVRREDNGKLLLIGVYSSNIIVDQLPAVLVLTLMLGIERIEETPEAVSMDFRVLLNEKQLRIGKGVINLNVSGTHLVPVGPLVLDKIETAGQLDFQIRMKERDWETATKVPIVLRKK